MGIIRRQSIQASILYYIGAGIGFVNKILIFTNFLSTEEVGLANILVTTAMMYAQFSALGFQTVTLKFFPLFADNTRKHHHFLFWLVAIPGLGFLLVTSLVLIFKPFILEHFRDNSPLFADYFYYLVPLGFATLYFDLIDAYLRSLMKTVVPILFREIIQKVLIAVSILLYAVGWLDFPEFVAVYVTLISSVTLLMLVYTSWLGHLHWLPNRSWRARMLLPKMMIYGGYNLLGNISAIILYNIDSLMLAYYVDMGAVGIYTTSFYVTALIIIPWRALQKIAGPQIAESWTTKDFKKMNLLYQRTSSINTVVGAYLYVMMIVASTGLFHLMPAEYEAGFGVMLIIGGTRILEMITGLNVYILMTSPKYRIDLIFNLFILFLSVFLNLVFISWLQMGIEGAAWATAIALAVSNLARITFLWIKYNLQPFSWDILWTILITGIALLAVFALPTTSHWLIDLVLRSFVFSAIFVASILYFRVIPDANNFLQLVVNKAKGRRRNS